MPKKDTGPGESSELFAKFLSKNGIGPVAAGKALGVSHVTILNWCSGLRHPTKENKQRIFTWTGEAVPFDRWGNEVERPDVAPFMTGIPPV